MTSQHQTLLTLVNGIGLAAVIHELHAICQNKAKDAWGSKDYAQHARWDNQSITLEIVEKLVDDEETRFRGRHEQQGETH